MRCITQLSGTRQTIGLNRVRRIMAAIAFVVMMCAATSGFAQSPTPTSIPTPTASPTPVPMPTSINDDQSAGNSALNLGSNFLERLGNQASNGFNRVSRTNPGGGGASAATEDPRYRTWFEGYGVSVRTDAQGDFVGDKRKTFGGVAGFGARVAPGVNLGFSVDQSHTDIDVPLALQSATLDLTQLGFSGSVDKGPWTWAFALVHGFGKVHSSRDTGLGFATAGYRAAVDGALTEISYYWTRDQMRIVPKAALEYVRATGAAFQEAGGLDPLSVGSTALSRARVMIGAEIGRYFILDQKILDLSAYSKFVDNFHQDLGSVQVSLGTQNIVVPGIGESRFGMDAGASASLSLTSTARLYVNYDGKFRNELTSHQGTVGFEYRW
ncbi:autotransporter outer membrane beta-barrel domain-containing protein [Bradyrhizobium diazoefficiens]|nr:autotransporter outer membrane beta-barrel domain-containing protein [Bradyrhizobium diazoefficiens]UCF55003.1 MAG: autotransporter outer membrane beta-barrel domain-containing protein [Bradyrhizobium sp.]MBR0962903.1 autotransporter outer membrane beta-barrel domain-containing protein [Bradyrhizobium diazoefficiens]MBR0977063.1 autotransporter outer membrane beta-barrel domain-containing protein [Bradyrhizobium diazoefficiens]MBR1005708.1 autotransporter outer membrane beta-barrel domain-co